MKIGIDIDEVIAEQLDELIKFYHMKTGKLVEKDKFHTYYWPDVWKISIEEAIAIDHEFKKSEFFDNIKPAEKAVEVIKQLIKNNEIFIITSRPLIFKERTENWLKRHLGDLNFELIHSENLHKNIKMSTKAKICKEFGIKIILEDDIRYALDCAESGVKVVLFDKPWNQNVKHKNIIRVKNWIEALKEMEILVK